MSPMCWEVGKKTSNTDGSDKTQGTVKSQKTFSRQFLTDPINGSV